MRLRWRRRRAAWHGLPLVFAALLTGLVWPLAGFAQTVRGEVSAAVENGFARIVFTLAEDIEPQVRVANGIVVLSFQRAVDINVDKLSAAAPGYVSAARQDPNGRGIRIALARKVTVNTMTAGERLFVDLLPDSWTGLSPGLPREVIEELARRAREAEKKLRAQRVLARQMRPAPVRLRVARQPTFTRYTFDLPELIGVVTNHDKDWFTLTFDAPLKFDFADAKATLPPVIGSIESAEEQQAVTVRFNFLGKVDVRTFREQLSYIVDITPMEEKRARAENQAISDELAEFAARLAADKLMPAAGEAPPTVPARNAPAGNDQLSPPSPATLAQTVAPVTRPAPPAPSAPVVAQNQSAPATPAATRDNAAESPHVPKDQSRLSMMAAASSTPTVAAPAPAMTPPSLPPAEPAPAPVPAAAEAAPADGQVVEVALKRQGDNLTFSFPFTAPTPAAIFRRGDMLWLVFDTDASIGLTAFDRETSHVIKGATVSRRGDLAVVRVRLERPRLISAAADGAGWTIAVGGDNSEPTRSLAVSRNGAGAPRASIAVALNDPRHLHRLEDPEAGDTLLVVTALGPPRGFVNAYEFVEFRALVSTHGVVVQPLADDLEIEFAADQIVLGRPAGLTLSSTQTAPRPPDLRPHVLDAQTWGFDRQAEFGERQSQLIHAAAQAPAAARAVARADLARFYLARDMAGEAKGVLDVALADNPPTPEDVTALVLRAIANIMLRRPEPALKDLANPFVGNQHDAPLWRAVAHARQGKWRDAREGFRQVGMSMGTLPIELQRVMMTEMIRASIEVSDITSALKEVHELEAVGVTRELEPTVALLTGRLAEALGRLEDALRAYRTAADLWDRPVAAQGRLREISLRRRLGNIERGDALSALETVAAIWRGDETELEALQILARLYGEQQRYRDAFNIMRTTLTVHPNSEVTRRIQDEAAENFDALFLGGGSDPMPPIDALSLFYDFRELTPIGRRGDEMIRRLADRLVTVDLLEQAAALLQHQIDHRLQGAARSQVAARLAVIYLMNRKAERTLATLRATRISDLSNELRNQRLLLEARALSETGRHDLGLEIIQHMEGRETVRLRADILWAGRRWRDAAEQIELLLGERWREFEPLTDSERSDILRAGIGFALGEDGIGLDRIREKYAAKMGEGADARAFNVVSAPVNRSGGEFRDIARAIASIDTLDAFLRDLRARYPETAIARGGRQG